MIYKDTVKIQKFKKPIQFYGGIHHNCIECVDEIRIEIGRQATGFYLMANAYNNAKGINYSVYLSLNNLDIKVADYHRMATSKINKLKTDRKILSMTDGLIVETMQRISEYKEPRNDNY
jgi:hypothetical protein